MSVIRGHVEGNKDMKMDGLLIDLVKFTDGWTSTVTLSHLHGLTEKTKMMGYQSLNFILLADMEDR